MFLRSVFLAAAVLSLAPAAIAATPEPSDRDSSLTPSAEQRDDRAPGAERSDPIGAILGFDGQRADANSDEQAQKPSDSRRSKSRRPRSMSERGRMAPKIAQADRLVFY